MKEIYAALSRAMERVAVAGRDGRHTQGWSYSSDAEIIRVAKEALAAEGLTAPILVEVMELDPHQWATKGGSIEIYRAVFSWEIGHSSGEAVRMTTIGSAQMSDRAPYAALTGARKNALTTLLCIERSDDPERQREPAGLSEADAVGVLTARRVDVSRVRAYLAGRGRDLATMQPAARSALLEWLADPTNLARVMAQADPPVGVEVGVSASLADVMRQHGVTMGMIQGWLAASGRSMPTGDSEPVIRQLVLEEAEAIRMVPANRAAALAQIGVTVEAARALLRQGGEARDLDDPGLDFAAFYRLCKTRARK